MRRQRAKGRPGAAAAKAVPAPTLVEEVALAPATDEPTPRAVEAVVDGPTAEDLRGALRMQFTEGGDAGTIGQMKDALTDRLHLPCEALNHRHEEVKMLAGAVLDEMNAAKVAAPHGLAEAEHEELGEEQPDNVRQCYLVTFPHPKQTHNKDGFLLKPPSNYTRLGVLEAIASSVRKTDAARQEALPIDLMSDFREKHVDGNVHDHAPLKAGRPFRYNPVK